MCGLVEVEKGAVSDLMVTKTPNGSLIPFSDEDAEKIRRFKVGKLIRMTAQEMRNGAYFRKWWALAKTAYDLWADTVPPQQYKGVDVLPDFDRFRRDLIILAGFYRATFNARGEVRLEAESLKWSQMTEERFDQLYSKTIDVILASILPNRGLTEDSLREWGERVMEFA